MDNKMETSKVTSESNVAREESAGYETPSIKSYTGQELENVILTVNAATGGIFP